MSHHKFIKKQDGRIYKITEREEETDVTRYDTIIASFETEILRLQKKVAEIKKQKEELLKLV